MNPVQKLILRSYLSPGDTVMLTAAVRDLHRAFPGEYLTDVRTTAPALWENNPYVTPLNDNEPNVRVIEMHYPLIHQSNTRPYHFIHGFTQHLEEQLGIKTPVTDFKGDIHLADIEKQWMSQVQELGFQGNFWIVMAGGKFDLRKSEFPETPCSQSPNFSQTLFAVESTSTRTTDIDPNQTDLTRILKVFQKKNLTDRLRPGKEAATANSPARFSLRVLGGRLARE